MINKENIWFLDLEPGFWTNNISNHVEEDYNKKSEKTTEASEITKNKVKKFVAKNDFLDWFWCN